MKCSLKVMLIFVTLIVSNISHAKQIKFVNNQGRSLLGKIISTTEDTVKFSLIKNGKTYTLPISNFNQETQDAIAKWVEEGGNMSYDFEVNVTTGRTKRTGNDADFDDKRINLSPKVSVKNKDANLKSQELNLVICFLGRPVLQKRNIHVFTRDNFQIKTLDPLKSVEFKCKKTSRPYDDRNYAQFGSRYLGYCWALVKGSGDDKKIIQSGSVPSFIAKKYSEKISELKANYYYDKHLELVTN